MDPCQDGLLTWKQDPHGLLTWKQKQAEIRTVPKYSNMPIEILSTYRK